MSTYPGYSAEGSRVSDDGLRETAVKRLKARREFQAHLLAYVLVNGFLVVIWAMTGAAFFWPIFLILGWGIGLAFHAWSVYAPVPTAKQIETEMERLRRSER